MGDESSQQLIAFDDASSSVKTSWRWQAETSAMLCRTRQRVNFFLKVLVAEGLRFVRLPRAHQTLNRFGSLSALSLL